MQYLLPLKARESVDVGAVLIRGHALSGPARPARCAINATHQLGSNNVESREPREIERTVAQRQLTPRQIFNVGIKRNRDPLKYQDRRVPPPVFNAAEIGLMHARLVCQLLLTKLACTAQPLHIAPHSASDIHAGIRDADLTSGHRL